MGDKRAPVAIVGAGFSGTMAAANLARRGIGSILIESNGQAGQGAAYSTTEPSHLLNIRAENMGAWAHDPGHFAKSEEAPHGTFAQRRHFGRYLRRILDDARAGGLVEVVEDRAIAAAREGAEWRIELAGGGDVRCAALVLAMGNQPPAKLPFAPGADDRVIDNPWGEDARAAVEDAAARQVDVLIVGTSLTMIDVALSLDSAGHRGRIVALSRRGKIPLANGVAAPAPVEREELPEPKVRSIARWLRERSAEVGWHSAVDSLRPHSHWLWQSLPVDQKQLFLRFGRPWWDIHRHRIAPQVARRVDELVAERRLEIVGGRIVDVGSTGDAIEVTLRRRGMEEPEPPQRFGYLFNCTGPLADITRTADPLLGKLLSDGVAEPDELSIGLAVDERSRAAPGLWALGTLTKGRYWEMIAVPDIREQAAAVADDIAMELGR